MATITIPDELKSQAAARATEAGYASVDEYVVDVLRAETEVPYDLPAPPHLSVRTHEQIVALVTEGLGSPAQAMTQADFDRRRTELLQKHAPKVTH